MFTGHFAVALAGAGVSRRLPLGLLIVAAFGADLVEGGVAAFYIRDPTRAWSHSIPATAAVGLVLALGWKLAGGSWREGAVLFFTSVSHTLLDFITGIKTWWPGMAPAGLSLYERPFLETPLELMLCIAGWLVWRGAINEEHRSSAIVRLMLLVLLASQGALFMLVTLFGSAGDPDAMSKFVR